MVGFGALELVILIIVRIGIMIIKKITKIIITIILNTIFIIIRQNNPLIRACFRFSAQVLINNYNIIKKPSINRVFILWPMWM